MGFSMLLNIALCLIILTFFIRASLMSLEEIRAVVHNFKPDIYDMAIFTLLGVENMFYCKDLVNISIDFAEGLAGKVVNKYVLGYRYVHAIL